MIPELFVLGKVQAAEPLNCRWKTMYILHAYVLTCDWVKKLTQSSNVFAGLLEKWFYSRFQAYRTAFS